jgi:hypothetical protein
MDTPHSPHSGIIPGTYNNEEDVAAFLHITNHASLQQQRFSQAMFQEPNTRTPRPYAPNVPILDAVEHLQPSSLSSKSQLSSCRQSVSLFVTVLTCPQHPDHQPSSGTNPANSAAICTTHHKLRLSILVTNQQHTSLTSSDFTSPSPRYPDPLLPLVSICCITTASPPSVLTIPNTFR